MTEDLRQQLKAAVGAPGAPPVDRIVARGEQFARRQRLRRAGIAAGLVFVVGAGVGGLALATRGPAGRVEVRGATPVSPMTEPAVTVPLTPATAIPLSEVRWDQVTYPLQCGTTLQGPTPTQVLAVVYPQVNPGTQVAAVLVACHAGAGTPPRVLYVFDRASSPATPHLLQTVSDDRSATPARVTNTISAAGPDITAGGSTYSSSNIPRCCPDGSFSARWAWTGSGYRLAP